MSDTDYTDHLIVVDLVAVLADPSLAQLDAAGPAAVFLGRVAAASGVYERNYPPVVIIRTQPLPEKGAEPVAHLPAEGQPQ